MFEFINEIIISIYIRRSFLSLTESDIYRHHCPVMLQVGLLDIGTQVSFLNPLASITAC